VDRNLVAGMLADGMLAEIAPNPPIPVREGHWFVALPDRLRVRQVRQFRDWLVYEAEPAHTPLATASKSVLISR
jgi:DNA-binding transcriptional LysR family regulator